MKLSLLFRTIRHLRFTQVFYQIRHRLIKPSYRSFLAPPFNYSRLMTEPIPRENCLDRDRFIFLNIEHRFSGWDFTGNGMLWAYNQNYFDWINQEGLSTENGCYWIDKFIEDFPMNKVGLDSYPSALRIGNWVKFFCQHPECATKLRLDSLYSQTKLLEKKLEFHLLANHLLEDAYALFIASVFFCDERLYSKAAKLLKSQLKEQVLGDGAHFEQSPMYHCILLDRLLDCINIALVFKSQKSYSKMISEHLTSDLIFLTSYSERMLGHLESIVWKDRTIPLLNDAALGIAPTPGQIFDYANRLGLKWNAIPLNESGYRKLVGETMEAVVDVGNIAANYQPGHTHADVLNYELRIDGKPFVVDCGISTYDKTPRRQYERGTAAHNCIVVDGKDSSEVWGGFRVGRRCHVEVSSVEYRDKSHFNVKSLIASHNGFAKPCKRKFEMNDEGFTVEDRYEGEAVSFIHLAEGADDKQVKIEGAINIEEGTWKYSTEYNRFKVGKEIKITFKNHLKYTIR